MESPISFRFQTFDNPADPTFNNLLGINNEGLIAGFYGSGDAGHPNQGYLLTPPNSFTPVNIPSEAQTQLTGLNDTGITVGYFYPTNNGVLLDNQFGFYEKAGLFTAVNNPKTPTQPNPGVLIENQLMGVNNKDIAVGFYNDASGNSHGYTYNIDTGAFSADINDPAAVSTVTAAINEAGLLVGFYTDSAGGIHGFVDSQGHFTTVDAPGSTMTELLGVNNWGVAVGETVVGGVTHGLIFDTGTGAFITLDDPNASDFTLFNGLNDNGQIVGFYSDAADNTHGLLLTREAASDFNGDGRGDLFWQHTNGATSAWELNDTAGPNGVGLPNAAGWRIDDSGDFNGDGVSGDLVLRNTTSGMVDIWTDNGGRMAGADVTRVDLGWNIMGTADFNGDGKSDILWRNEQNGYVSVWLMNGDKVASTWNPGKVDLSWHIVGAADYAGTGDAEILWRNAATGEIDLWTMNPSTGTASGTKVATLGLEWQVVGSGDFNGDGKADILWHDNATGQVVIWEMNGTQVLASRPIANLGSQWQVASVVDGNSDGNADIVWRESHTGQVVTWAMDGFNVDHQGVLGTVADANWQTVNHHFDWV
jgi:hypothetical protein